MPGGGSIRLPRGAVIGADMRLYAIVLEGLFWKCGAGGLCLPAWRRTIRGESSNVSRAAFDA